MTVERCVCIHGHFYQPPRENPWLEAVEVQESAYPYHDWNERVTAESYRPNSRSRMLDGEGWITSIVNNYSRISFNFGPTLLSWMEAAAPDTYAAILQADAESRERFSGHGSAIAQGYGHIILPLSNDRDRRTQAVWGVRDFEHRFGRKPEGMWLPEAAVNTESLEALAEQGVAFTILAPRSARRIRRIGGSGRWRDVEGAIDPSRAYRCSLPSGRSISLFFYDGPISQAVAFERLLNSGEGFARRLLDGFDDARGWPQLAHIATDGETYGHHHRHGEMALTHALHLIESNPDVRLTNYGEFLENHPPTHEVQILENSSWSCVHGVGRWMADCGCNSGGHAEWNQAWRAPLREALDWLRDACAPLYQREAAPLLKDPWAARDAYIGVVLDRSDESRAAFFHGHATRWLEPHEHVRALKLLELQRHAMLMYTSCGWFFDDLSGIETTQVIRYAGRVIQLARDALGADLEPEFLERLSRARSNIPDQGDGRQIYLRYIKPSIVSLASVGGHYAVLSLFDTNGERASISCYDAVREDLSRLTAGRARLNIGRAALTSRITHDAATLSFAVLHLGEHVINGAVRPYGGPDAYAAMSGSLKEAFERADFPEVLRRMEDSFGGSNYSLGSLFRDEQHRVVRELLDTTLESVESNYRNLYEQHAPLCRYLAGLNLPIPRRLVIAVEFVLNTRLTHALEADTPDIEGARAAAREAKLLSVPLDAVTLEHAMRGSLARAAAHLALEPGDLDRLQQTATLVDLAHELPFETNLSELQNAVFALIQTVRPDVARAAAAASSGSDNEASRGAPGEWLATLDGLAAKLRIRVPPS